MEKHNLKKKQWWKGVTGYQWLVLSVAWLGWVFDSMDSTLYALVLHPALSDLLGPGAASSQIEWFGGIIFTIFLIGWAVGGVLFGIAADRFGRTRALIYTILIYSLFTGLAAFSRTWWELAGYRFITALGIGGEWAAGAALVAETWSEETRTQAAGILQSAWAAGFFIASLVNLTIGSYGWRWVFAAGILPALLTFLVRSFVREPDRWAESKRGDQKGVAEPGIGRLFQKDLRTKTLAGSLLAFVAVFGLWGATNWTPTLVRELLSVEHLGPKAMNRYVSYAAMALNAGSIAGYLSFGPIADRFGRKTAFFIMCLGSLIMLPAAFLVPHEYATLLWLLPFLGFFNNGIFSGFPIYLPELYPTRLRATGAGFCFNAGRIVASGGPFLKGYLGTLMSPGRAVSLIGLIYLVGIGTLWFAPETKGLKLPD